MTKCFVDVGLVRPVDQYKLPTNYVNYCRKQLGHASLKIEDDLNKGDCIAGWIIDFVQRADQIEESDEESDCDSVNVESEIDESGTDESENDAEIIERVRE